MRTFDFVVIGSGVAGLSFALRAARRGTVLILTKRNRGDSNTARAQGGMACVMSADDSLDLHIADTLSAGAGLGREGVVRTIISEGPARARELAELGVRFDHNGTQAGGPAFALAHEGGHSRRRILHVRDATGREIERALLEAVARDPQIEVLENHMAIDLITATDLDTTATGDAARCIGVYALDEATGAVHPFRSDRIVLATGGCGRVYRYTTNPAVATGDGVAIAWRAGAAVANMEFIQFHPTCLYHPAARSFLISEAVRGEGGRLVDDEGRAFMPDYHHLADLAPRDVVARAIDTELKRTGASSVYLDITHQPRAFLRARFPTIYEKCISLGIDIARDPIPVVPAAHYQCGGVLTDANGATTIPGLYAIGEVACTGLHGANRLASNSLLEAVVVAHRAAAELAAWSPPDRSGLAGPTLPEWTGHPAAAGTDLTIIHQRWDEIRRLMWDSAGIVRTDERLRQARARLLSLQAEIEGIYLSHRLETDLIELRNLATVALLIVESALARKESRGLHYNLDHPEPDPAGARDTVLTRI